VTRAAFVLGAISVVVSAVIWAIFIQPIDSAALQGLNDPDYIGGTILLIPLAAGAVAFGHYLGRWWALGLSALAAPLILAGFALAYHDELGWQREARDVFDRYTHRFPEDELGEGRIMEQTGSYITMCADQRSRRPTAFCVEMIMRFDPGEEVVGGFRYHPDETEEYGFVSAQPFDCFGDTIKCPAE
jgi:hypothetical protein